MSDFDYSARTVITQQLLLDDGRCCHTINITSWPQVEDTLLVVWWAHCDIGNTCRESEKTEKKHYY